MSIQLIKGDAPFNIYTSYFGNIKNIPSVITRISICGKAPAWYEGIQYKKLAPKWTFFSDYKEGIIDKNGYTTEFNKQVLSLLDVNDVTNDFMRLGRYGVVLLCYERPQDFCHRHIVSNWLEEKLNIIVREI